MSSAGETSGRTGWRTSKACQECRKRKIKCNGHEPCEMCDRRKTPCVYREITRQRKRKRVDNGNASLTPSTESSSGPQETTQNGYGDHQQSHYDNIGVIHSSVSATARMGPPGCRLQLYYGPTSHFSLVQHIYRCLNSDATDGSQHDGEVQEAGAGLDWVSLSGVFFGTNTENTAQESAGMRSASLLGSMPPFASLMAIRDPPVFFVSHELANLFMDNFITSIFVLCPSSSEQKYRHNLELLYQSGRAGPSANLDIFDYHHLLMALALGALASQHYHWGDILYERARASALGLDEVVNLQMNEQGRPNSAFLHVGTATRKAVAAGLHKAPQRESANRGNESFEAQNDTLWCLYFYETLNCFHVGRPTALSIKDISVPLPTKPFLRSLVLISQTNARCMDELYARRHQTLLQMRGVALSIYGDMLKSLPLLESFIGGKIDGDGMAKEQSSQQVVVVTSFNHSTLLNFRPFIIFKGRWLRDRQLGIHPANDVTDTPAWLSQICNYVVKAARRLILNFYRCTIIYPQNQEFRYHAFFLGSASATLIYDFIFDRESAIENLPFVHAALHTLSKMRHGDPIKCSMKALQTILKAIDPAYEWNPSSPPPCLHTLTMIDHSLDRTVTPPERSRSKDRNTENTATNTPRLPTWSPSNGKWDTTPQSQPSRPRSTPLQPQRIPDFLINPPQPPEPQLDASATPYPSAAVAAAASNPYVQAMGGPAMTGDYMPVTGGSLPDFSASDLGWDFATMDLEAFFSVYPTEAG